MKKTRTFVALVLIAFVSGLLHGQKSYIPQVVNPLTQSWRWKLFPDLEGHGVRDIFEGKDRSVWVAFNEGVFEFDGYSWKTHNADNGFISNPVEKVFVDNDGTAYAAASSGIYKFDGKSWQQIFKAPPDVNFNFNSLNEIDQGVIAGSSNRGLVIIKNGITIYTSEERIELLSSSLPEVDFIALPSDLSEEEDFVDISDFLADHNGMLWIAFTHSNERGKLLRVKTSDFLNGNLESFHIYKSNNQISLGETQKLLEARDGAIWVVSTTYKIGISKYHNGKWSYIKMNDKFGGDEYMTDIVESDDGTIWIGSLGKLYTYKDNNWAMYSAPDFPIPANQLKLQKSIGNYIWLAGNKSKVYYLDFSTDKWITYENLNFQFQNDLGEEWFLDVNGNVVFQKAGKWFAYTSEQGLMDAPIRLIQTRKGQIWAAGSHNGIASTALLEGDEWIRVEHPELSWGVDYRAVFEDKDGDLWFGAAVDAEPEKGQTAGLLRIKNPTSENRSWIHYPSGVNGLNQSNVYGIGQTDDGRIWIGGSSLFAMDSSGQWQEASDERLRQFVNVVYSKNGHLYAGSRYYGIFSLEGDEWKVYNKSNGLSGNTVISINEIEDNTLFVATDSDICRFDGESWVKNVFPSELNMEIEGGQLLKDRYGSLWINKSSRSWKRRAFTHNRTKEDGFKEFYTYKYSPDDMPPETEIVLFSEEVAPQGNTLIKWGGHDFYAQTSQDKLMYSYQLNGGEWSPFTYEDHFTFLSLKSGVHTVRVKARDLDLNVDTTPAEITFRVLPPVWKQTWFILLMLAFLTVLGIYEYRIITKKQKLEALNGSLKKVNQKLKLKSKKIQDQNTEILKQQEHNLLQAKKLEEINHDLEERNEEIRSQKEKLEEMILKVEELSKAKLGFFTNISHELRTPLTLISGPVQQLLEDESLPPSQKKKLYQIIERNSERLLKLINQLLEMRRIENSNLALEHKNVNLPEYLSEIISLYENLAVERDIILSFRNNSDLKEATIDPDKTEKIIVNLISNAFKHTPNGGAIEIMMNVINSNSTDLSKIHDQYLEISVRDTGSGITKEDLEHIYERFYATDGVSADHNSTGIGLAYTKELINVMNGEIKVASKVGSGTKFSIYIPLLDNAKASPLSPNEIQLKIARKDADLLLNSLNIEKEIKSALNAEDAEERKKILVVEDHKDMLLYIESILHNEYDVIKAADGLEGLEKASEFSIDLIISDVMMPNMNGLEFCEKIKSDISTSHIPIILLTAKVLEKNKIQGYEHGADGYIVKPFNPQLLLSRISNILEQRELLKEAFNRDFILKPKKLNITSPDEEMLLKIVRIMEENIENSDFNVNQMCKMVHLSHMHFIRKVKQLTGKKPVDLLKSFRLKRAKDLLVDGDISISEIAYKVGYDLPNSFSRAFKKEYGVSPKEFMFREKSGMS